MSFLGVILELALIFVFAQWLASAETAYSELD